MVIEDKTVEPWMERLFLPTYRVSEAARYVGFHPNTVSSWNHGNEPVLPGRAKRMPLSYLELIEVAFVALFRNLGIPMELVRSARSYRGLTPDNEMRGNGNSEVYDILPRDSKSGGFLFFAGISDANDVGSETREFNVHNIETEYPFASLRFKTEGLHILTEYHRLDPTAQIWKRSMSSDTLRHLNWVHITENQFADFDYDHELVIRWHPAGRDSQVMIDPRIAFGDPMVSGLPTWVIHGRYKAGESVPEIVADFEIPESAVWDALRFEGVQVD